MQLTSPGKLVAILAALVGCFVYIIVSEVHGSGDATPAWSTIALLVGYLVGNGTGALRGDVTPGVFQPKGAPPNPTGASITPPSTTTGTPGGWITLSPPAEGEGTSVAPPR